MVDSSTFEFDDLVIEKVIGTRTRKTIGGPEEYEANLYQFHVPVYYAGGLHEPPDVDMALHSTREYLRDILQDVLCYASSDKLIGWWENQQANWNTEEAQP